jgi:hypothetical protein
MLDFLLLTLVVLILVIGFGVAAMIWLDVWREIKGGD